MPTEQVKPGFLDRLRQMIGKQAPYAWARDVGIGKSTFDGIWKKGAQPQLRTLLKIAWKTDISLSWLLTGKGSSRIRDSATAISSSNITTQQTKMMSYILAASQNSADFGFSTPAGELNEQQEDYLAFTTTWITQEMKLDPKELALVTVQGDSMSPTLNTGDLLLLDRREKQMGNDGIYVIQQDNNLIAKRLQRGVDGSVMVKNDNHAYETQTLLPEEVKNLKIVGRVKWTGQRV
ncbi:MAG: helix-turn-helix transcriptional regulator [Magnetococcales bacterium]|nr:helix-turn-helix transcriptional regulator [Magnetococcales bacterium]